jgi:hypothetical protein
LVTLFLYGCQTVELDETDYIPAFKTTPQNSYGTIGHKVQEHRLQRDNGSMAFGASVMVNPNAPHVVVFPGNMQSVDRSLDTWSALVNGIGANLHLFDRRGQGRSEGTVSASALGPDAQAVVDFVRSTYEAEPVLLGYSLGGFEAVAVAKEGAPEKLVLVATSTNIDEHIDASVPWYFKPFVDFHIDASLYELDNLAGIASIHADTLLIAAEDDRQTPASLSLNLYRASAAKNVRLHVLANTHHNNVLQNTETAVLLCRFLGLEPCGEGEFAQQQF